MFNRFHILTIASLLGFAPYSAPAQPKPEQKISPPPIVYQLPQPVGEKQFGSNHSRQLVDSITGLLQESPYLIIADTTYGSLRIERNLGRDMPLGTSQIVKLKLTNENHNIAARVFYDMQDSPTRLFLEDVVQRGPGRVIERGINETTLARESKNERFPKWEIKDEYWDDDLDGGFDKGWNLTAPLERIPKNKQSEFLSWIEFHYAGPQEASYWKSETRREFQERFSWRLILANAALRTYISSNQNTQRLSRSLIDILDGNLNNLPVKSASTSYGSIIYARRLFGELFADYWNQSRSVDSPDKVTPDTIEESFVLDSASSNIRITIPRKAGNWLSLNISIGQDSSIPNYRSAGYRILDYGRDLKVRRTTDGNPFHGYNDADFVDIGKIAPKDARHYREQANDILKASILGIREYLHNSPRQSLK